MARVQWSVTDWIVECINQFTHAVWLQQKAASMRQPQTQFFSNCKVFCIAVSKLSNMESVFGDRDLQPAGTRVMFASDPAARAAEIVAKAEQGSAQCGDLRESRSRAIETASNKAPSG